uniref:DUF7041 domain-containing protein n=1 Tax=Mesocestoides corti TaxID=53468 RepID=A0A5K3FR83_MESCO
MPGQSPSKKSKQSTVIKLPVYCDNPQVWFLKVEALFRIHNIGSQHEKFDYIVSQLPCKVANMVADLLYPIPSENPYEKLKNGVITRMNKFYESCLINQLSSFKLGTKSPSQLLREMVLFASHHKIDDSVLTRMWTKCLPAEIQEVLSLQRPDTPLENLAEFADMLHKFMDKGGETQNRFKRS